MPLHTDEEILALDYLLGRLGGERRELAEARLFADDGFFLFVRGREEELIRDHLTGRLSRADERAFAVRYLETPLLQEKVRFVSAVMQVASGFSGSGPTSERPAWRWFDPGRAVLVFACAAAALLAVGLFRNEIIVRRLDSQIAGLRKGQIELQGAAERAIARRVLTSFFLTPGLNRDSAGRARVFAMPAGAGQIEFQLLVDGAGKATRWRVSITTAEGTGVWGRVVASDPSRPDAVVIAVPVNVFGNEDYVAVVDNAGGAALHESYSFRIAR